MNIEKMKTLGDLKSSGYISKGIKDELRDNLIEKIKNNEPAFTGIHGYDDTVIPELERAILSKHNINLLKNLSTFREKWLKQYDSVGEKRDMLFFDRKNN